MKLVQSQDRKVGGIMNKEKYVSWCKQEDLTITIIAMILEVFIFGFVFPVVVEELLGLSIVITLISLVLSLFIFWRNNKKMMLCYKLMHGNGITRKAVVEDYKIKLFKNAFSMTIWFRVLDTGTVYEWKEQYTDSAFHNLASQMYQFLGTYPEIEVLLDPCNHRQHYILFEQVMFDGIRKGQGIFKVINIILGIVLLVLILALLVKTCILCI